MDYKFSFTAAGLLIQETLTIARTFASCNDWDLTRQNVIENNLLQKEKEATAKRQYMEIELRLKNLSSEQIELLCNGSQADAVAMIWLSVIKTYSFISDFVLEILCVNYTERHYIVTDGQYNMFWESKKAINETAAKVSDNTAKKIKQVVFKMIQDVGIITSIKERAIIKPIISSEVEGVIINDNPKFLTAFLYESYEIKQLIDKYAVQ